MFEPIDKLLLEARDYSVRLEQSAAHDLSENLEYYLPPSWTVRRVLEGYKRYANNGENDIPTFKHFRAAFSETQGRSNLVFSNVIGERIGKTEKYDFSQTMFDPDIDAEKIVKIGAGRLNNHGFFKTSLRVPEKTVDSLKFKILKHLEADNGHQLEKAMRGADDAPLQIKGRHSWVATIDEMYDIAGDPILLAVVQEYLGLPPIFTTPVVFLNSARKVKSDLELDASAQLYHHDLQRLQFVKLFIYLTDVDAESGPHKLIRGTHRNRPDVLWADQRHADETVEAAGIMDDEITITGPAGTVFLVDTSAMHKGANPISNHRLMAQIQYSNSLFGKPWPETERKISMAAKSDNAGLNKAASLVRKHALRSGVRFMQNYI